MILKSKLTPQTLSEAELFLQNRTLVQSDGLFHSLKSISTNSPNLTLYCRENLSVFYLMSSSIAFPGTHGCNMTSQKAMAKHQERMFLLYMYLEIEIISNME